VGTVIVKGRTGIMIFSPARSGMRAGIQKIPKREVGFLGRVVGKLNIPTYSISVVRGPGLNIFPTPTWRSSQNYIVPVYPVKEAARVRLQSRQGTKTCL
jgi:hypothetical protein